MRERNIHLETRGQWRGILSSLGLDQRFLNTKRHGPCPQCGGKDRYRFTDHEGLGRWICSQCGSGSGMDMAMWLTGADFQDTADRVREVAGKVTRVAGTWPNPEQQRQAAIATWKAARPVQDGDPVDRYLRARGIGMATYPPTIRHMAEGQSLCGKTLPAMLLAVQDSEGAIATVHRTFLGDGAKADVDTPRALMPGEFPPRAAWRCGPSAGVMGIAEGVETAMSAAYDWGIPVWAGINARRMADWWPPEGTHRVLIFGDNDASFTGHSASYRLARMLAAKKIAAEVHVPDAVGTDWNDPCNRGERRVAA